MAHVLKRISWSLLALALTSLMVSSQSFAQQDTSAQCQGVRTGFLAQEAQCVCSDDISVRETRFKPLQQTLPVLQGLGCDGGAQYETLCGGLHCGGGDECNDTRIRILGFDENASLNVDETLNLTAVIDGTTCDECGQPGWTGDVCTKQDVDLQGQVTWYIPPDNSSSEVISLSAADRTAVVTGLKSGTGTVCAQSTDVPTVQQCININVGGCDLSLTKVRFSDWIEPNFNRDGYWTDYYLDDGTFTYQCSAPPSDDNCTIFGDCVCTSRRGSTVVPGRIHRIRVAAFDFLQDPPENQVPNCLSDEWTWSSSDPSIMSVTNDGGNEASITLINEGWATLTAENVNNPEIKGELAWKVICGSRSECPNQ